MCIVQPTGEMSAEPGIPIYETLERAWGTWCWECNGAQIAGNANGAQGAGNAMGHRVLEQGHELPGDMNSIEWCVLRAYLGTSFLGCSPLALNCSTRVTLIAALFYNKWLQGSMPSSASLSHPEMIFHSHAFQSFCPKPVSLAVEFRN